MKTVLQILLAPLALLAGSLLYAECPYPAEVDVPEGDTATEEEMVAGQKIVKQYMADMESYLDCIDEEDAELGKDKTDEQQKMHVQRYNAAVDAMENVAAQFNSQVKAYKANEN